MQAGELDEQLSNAISTMVATLAYLGFRIWVKFIKSWTCFLGNAIMRTQIGNARSKFKVEFLFVLRLKLCNV